MSSLPESFWLGRPVDQDLLWQDEALCAQVGGDIFFPEKGGSSPAAKATCGRCPVNDQCLEYALENREEFGYWAGTSPKERKRIVRQRGEVWRSSYRSDEDEELAG